MKLIPSVIICCLLQLMFSSCSEHSNLTDAVESAWSDIEDKIEEDATERCEYYAAHPEELYSSNCETEFISLTDNFILTIPFQNEGYAAVSLFFGSDAADFLSLIDNTTRGSKTKQDVKKLIEKHFNPSWATLFDALIILDGSFSYTFEMDDWFDNSIDFESKELYRILNENGYFEGSYGEPTPTVSSDYSSGRSFESSYSSDDDYSSGYSSDDGYGSDYSSGTQSQAHGSPIEISSPNAFSGYNHEFVGKVGGKAIHMNLNLEEYEGSIWFRESDENDALEITSFNPSTREITIRQIYGNSTFKGKLTHDGILTGTYIRVQGPDQPFRLVVNDAP